MKSKLEYLLQSENLTATSLARLLEIQPSGLSHILSGRNKPSFDLVVKILRAFPKINPDWLLLDSSQIYRDAIGDEVLVDSPTSEIVSSRDELPFAANENIEISQPQEEQKNEKSVNFVGAISGLSSPKKVERIIVLYDDSTFDSYRSR